MSQQLSVLIYICTVCSLNAVLHKDTSVDKQMLHCCVADVLLYTAHYAHVTDRLVIALETKRVVQAVCGSYHTAGLLIYYNILYMR
jgi:hypothetical protein